MGVVVCVWLSSIIRAAFDIDPAAGLFFPLTAMITVVGLRSALGFSELNNLERTMLYSSYIQTFSSRESHREEPPHEISTQFAR